MRDFFCLDMLCVFREELVGEKTVRLAASLCDPSQKRWLYFTKNPGLRAGMTSSNAAQNGTFREKTNGDNTQRLKRP